MVDKDNKIVKKVKPILIKKEIERSYARLEQFKKHVGEISFTDEERVVYREVPPLPYDEEVTDNEDYREDDEIVSVKSDSSATQSMLDEDFENTDPTKFDASLMKVTASLRQAAERFEELRQMLPSVPITDMPKIIEEMPLPYLNLYPKKWFRCSKVLGRRS